MVGYQPYPEYQESGVEWLGEVPKNWEIKKLKFVAVVQPSNVDKKTEDNEEPILLCNYTDVYKNEFIDSSFEFMKATATKTEIEKFSVDVGDVIVTKDSESPDDIAVPACVVEKVDGLVCGYHLTQIKGRDIDGKYLFRLFQSEGFNAQFIVAANGVTRFGLPQHAISNAFASIPSEKEQQTIAHFLDHKTVQIDALIAKKQTLLEKLAEKRTALISQAVTKGLNPSVKMKDSGVEWLGEIPMHWMAIRIRHCSSFVTSGSRGWAEFFADEGSPFLRITNVTRDTTRLLQSDIQRVIPPAGAEGARTATAPGDVIVSITADLGSVAVIPSEFEPSFVSQHLALVRPLGNKVIGQWMAFQIFSPIGKNQLIGAGYGGTKVQLSLGDIKDLWIALPPVEEQNAINGYLDGLLDELAKQGGKIQKATHLLAEYRSALITQAVTGKIDVRNVKIPEATAKGQAA